MEREREYYILYYVIWKTMTIVRCFVRYSSFFFRPITRPLRVFAASCLHFEPSLSSFRLLGLFESSPTISTHLFLITIPIPLLAWVFPFYPLLIMLSPYHCNTLALEKTACYSYSPVISYTALGFIYVSSVPRCSVDDKSVYFRKLSNYSSSESRNRTCELGRIILTYNLDFFLSISLRILRISSIPKTLFTKYLFRSSCLKLFPNI